MRRLKNGGRCGIVLPEGQILFGGGAFQGIREELLSKFKVTAIISLPQGVFSQMGAGVKTNLIFFEKTGATKEIWYGEVEGKFTKKQIVKDSDLEEVYKKWQKKEVSGNSWVVSIDELKKKSFDLSPKNPNKADEEELPSPEELINRIQEAQKGTASILSNIKKLF
jgi:type I restriction enzyme M protein